MVKTSNPGSQTLQELTSHGIPIYEYVSKQVQKLASETLGSSGWGSVCAVVGATYPQQLSELRDQMPNAFFLVPVLGAQGGTAEDIAGKGRASAESFRNAIFTALDIQAERMAYMERHANPLKHQ